MTCPSDDPSCTATTPLSLEPPDTRLPNESTLRSTPASAGYLIVDTIRRTRRTSLLMSRSQNRSPRGRSLNDVLLTPPRLAPTIMNHRRAPRRPSTALLQSDNPMNLPRARRFLPRNDLPSNRDDLFELVVQTTTSALTQNLQIEELIPILCRLRHRRAEDISNVLADVTQLLERDLLALIGLSEAITRIPTTPPAAPPAPAFSSRRRTRHPVVSEDTDNEETPRPRPARATLLHTGSCFECFSPGHIRINCRWYQCPMCHSSQPGHLSRLCPLRVVEETMNPPRVDTPTLHVPLHVNEETPTRSETPERLSTPDSLRVTEDPPVATATTDDDSLIGSSIYPAPRSTEENPDPDILIDRRLTTSPVLVATAERSRPDLIVTPSDEPSTSSSFAVEEVSNEERLLLEWSDVYPIEILSPTPTRFVPVTPSPLREYFVEDSTTLAPQSPAHSSPELESPTSTSLRSRSSNYSDVDSRSSSPVNDDAEDSARSF
ncbi:hypothetical protein BU15DRAFT_75435 [Melanogaster broomeanus]|nr:hypothetical protein BU15DRAFT_75435 [Melanogaster broomeanus]